MGKGVQLGVGDAVGWVVGVVGIPDGIGVIVDKGVTVAVAVVIIIVGVTVAVVVTGAVPLQIWSNVMAGGAGAALTLPAPQRQPCTSPLCPI